MRLGPRSNRQLPADLLKTLCFGAPLGLVLLLGGCRVRLIDVRIVNRGPAMQLLEFDYPSASFGIDNLASGGVYPYSFAVQEAGPLTLHFEDGAGHSYTANGPTVNRGQKGSLIVTIGRGGQVSWTKEWTVSK